MEPTEPTEPRKRRHRPRRGPSFHTRRGPGLREFMNKLPQIKKFDQILKSDNSGGLWPAPTRGFNNIAAR